MTTKPFTTLPDELERRFALRNHLAHWRAIVESMKLTTLDNRYLTLEDCQRINTAIQAALAVLGESEEATVYES